VLALNGSIKIVEKRVFLIIRTKKITFLTKKEPAKHEKY